MPDARCPMLMGWCAYNACFDYTAWFKIFTKLTINFNFRTFFVLFFSIIIGDSLFGQSNSCNLNTINNKIIKVCGANCTNVVLNINNIKQTTDYRVKQTEYKPYGFVSPTGIEYSDMYNLYTFTSVKSLPFQFSFYDSLYNYYVGVSTGIISFDTTNRGPFCGAAGQNGSPLPYNLGNQCTGDGYIPKASIYSIHFRMDPRIGPFLPSPPDRKIEFRTEGQSPCRRFIVSYYKIGTWGTNGGMQNCWPDGQSTFQTVLYESTGIIETYIEKYICPAQVGSASRATLGLQNYNRDKAVCPPGKNAQVWTATNEAYQFTPSGGATRFVSSNIYTLNGLFVGTADTSSASSDSLTLKFNTICTTADTTKYLVKTKFRSYLPNDTITYTDTILLVRQPNVNASLTVPNICNGDTSRTITVNASGDNFIYGLNNGNLQPNPIFTNMPLGNNTVSVAGLVTGCTAIMPAVIGANNIFVSTRSDTAICALDTLLLTTQTNATNILWQPNIGLSNNAVLSPRAELSQTTTYIVTAEKNNCIAKDTITITVLPKPIVNAGADITIVNGYDAQLNGIVDNAVSFVWSPTTYLNSANNLAPTVQKPAASVTYQLTATSASGCKTTDAVQVTVLPYCIAIKEAFTPNADGINDNWIVYNSFSCLKNVAVNVYNRYGSLVYQNKNYTNQWNGTYNNKPIPDGTYYYNITYTLVGNIGYTVKGNVTVLR